MVVTHHSSKAEEGEMKCGEKLHKFEPTRFLCACLESVLSGNIVCHMCLGGKRIENNRSSVRTAISLCSTLSLLGKKGFFTFCLGLKTIFWWLVKIAFLSTT